MSPAYFSFLVAMMIMAGPALIGRVTFNRFHSIDFTGRININGYFPKHFLWL